MAMLAPVPHAFFTNTPSSLAPRLLARHHAETERALASVRTNAFLDDRDRARRITEIVAEANARVLAMTSAAARHCPVPGCCP
jgi:hypothetical protein